MIRLLLKILRPKNIPVNKVQWNVRVRLYHWMLCRLMSCYKRSAISDTIHIGNIQIIHNVRDYWYEQELQRFNINTGQHLENEMLPAKLSQKYNRSGLFEWSETLLLFHEGKSICIKRSKNIFVESDFMGKFRCSDSADFITRTEFESKSFGMHEHHAENRVHETNFQNASRRTGKFQGFEENDVF